ncbi:hypothetical protein Tco_1514850 [Tanacetum coccineum]
MSPISSLQSFIVCGDVDRQSTIMPVLQKTPEHKDKTSLRVVVGRHKRRHWIDNQFYNLYEICIFELSLANTTNLTLDKVFSIKTQDQSTSASAYPTTTGASSTAATIPESVKGQEQLQKEKEETRSEQEARDSGTATSTYCISYYEPLTKDPSGEILDLCVFDLRFKFHNDLTVNESAASILPPLYRN